MALKLKLPTSAANCPRQVLLLLLCFPLLHHSSTLCKLFYAGLIWVNSFTPCQFLTTFHKILKRFRPKHRRKLKPSLQTQCLISWVWPDGKTEVIMETWSGYSDSQGAPVKGSHMIRASLSLLLEIKVKGQRWWCHRFGDTGVWLRSATKSTVADAWASANCHWFSIDSVHLCNLWLSVSTQQVGQISIQWYHHYWTENCKIFLWLFFLFLFSFFLIFILYK